jgi:hypothetical protein
MTNMPLQGPLDADEAALISAWRSAKRDPRSLPSLRALAEQQWRRIENVGRAKVGSDALVALGFAVLVAIAVQLPSLFGLDFDRAADYYARNLGLLVLPVLAGFLWWRRGAPRASLAILLAMSLGAAVVANLPAFARDGDFVALTALHVPIALWLAVGIAHAGGRWHEVAARMDFVRFSGELFILYVLIALGGGVFSALMMGLFNAIGIDLEVFFGRWLLPCCASGAVIVAAWLVDTRQGGVGRIAPLLARVFTPLFTLLLLAFLVAKVASGHGFRFDRELIIVVDALLVLVLGLILYAISARAPERPPGAFDRLQLLLVISTLLVDVLVMSVVVLRISEFGFTPNRTAALGLNLLLFANLAWSAVGHGRFLRRHGTFDELERGHMRYLPAYAIWATAVAVAFPLLF